MVQTYKYLGLIINRNGNFNKTIEDRIVKTKRALFVLKQALSTSCNVPVPLAMLLFDKRIQPILLYGLPIWSIPSSHTHINMTLENISEKNTKEHISNCLKPLGFDKVNLISIRVYKAKNMITIKLDNVITKLRILYNYKKNFLKKTPVTYHIMDHEIQSSSVETVHTHYCKFMLGISKYESTKLTLGELGRFPHQNKATCPALSYWIRLEQGTYSVILNRVLMNVKKEIISGIMTYTISCNQMDCKIYDFSCQQRIVLSIRVTGS